MSVLYRLFNVTVMQHAATLVDLFNVHVTMDLAEMEQVAKVRNIFITLI